MRNFLLWTGALGLLAMVAGVAPSAAEDRSGEALFELCTQCHGAAGGGNPSVAAPAIAGLPEWYVTRQLENFYSGARGKHFDDVEGMRMRPMSLALRHEGDIPKVSAYVAALPLVPQEETVEGDAAKGKTLYMLCASCHGLEGQGSEPQGGPPLIGQSDWYMVTQLEKYKAGVRGKNPKDTFGLMMQGMALTLADDQAIADVVAHINTFSK